MKCDEVREMLPAYSGTSEGHLALRRHLARCPECRTEMESYELLTGALGDLSHATVEPPVTLLRALERIPETATRAELMKRHLTKNKRKYAAGGIAVAVLGAAGAAVLARRPRPA